MVLKNTTISVMMMTQCMTIPYMNNHLNLAVLSREFATPLANNTYYIIPVHLYRDFLNC